MIRKRWLALIGAVLGPLTCFGGARADEGIIIIHPGPSAGGGQPGRTRRGGKCKQRDKSGCSPKCFHPDPADRSGSNQSTGDLGG